MYTFGAKASNSQNLKSTSNTLKSTKNCLQQPPNQIRSASAGFTKSTAILTTAKKTSVNPKSMDPEKPINRYVTKSKNTGNKSTIKQPQIPFVNNRGIRALKLSRESTSLNLQGIKSQKSIRESTTIDSISDKLSAISKRDSRKDIYNSAKIVDHHKKSECNELSTGKPLRTEISIGKAPNFIRSLSATTSPSNPLRKRNIYSTEQNSCKNPANVPLRKERVKPKNFIAKAPNQIRSLSATASACNPNIKNFGNENSKIPNEDLSPRGSDELAIQTNEDEIMDHSLVVGDIKIMKPSKSVVEEIEKLRLQIKTKKLLKTTRKFEEHSARDEEHLNDLKEFLEKSYVTKKERKVQGNLLKDDIKLFASMDEFLNRQIPKTESISDIKARIKRKEQELLSLFDKVPNTCLMSNKN